MRPTEPVVSTAQAMSELDVGVIPVCDGNTLVGVVTDRDIVLRAVAEGRSAETTPVSTVMSTDACWCFEDEPVRDVAEQMRTRQIRRIAVLDRDQQLVGMLSLGDVATKDSNVMAGNTLEAISEPSTPSRSDPSSADEIR